MIQTNSRNDRGNQSRVVELPLFAISRHDL